MFMFIGVRTIFYRGAGVELFAKKILQVAHI